jgi:hypothetical protein
MGNNMTELTYCPNICRERSGKHEKPVRILYVWEIFEAGFSCV